MSRRGRYTQSDEGFVFPINTSLKDIHNTALTFPPVEQPLPSSADGYGDDNPALSHHGYSNEFTDLPGQSSVEHHVYLPDDPTRPNSLREAPFPINRFLRAQDAPWTGLRHEVEHPSLANVFGGYHTPASFAIQPDVPSLITPSDSGYETQPKKSVGVPSVHGDSDLGGTSSSAQLHDMRLNHGSVYNGSTTHTMGHSPLLWPQDAPSELSPSSRIDTASLKCDDCPDRIFASKSDLKKHVNRHKRPFHCSVTTCDYNRKGFGTSNDRDRHMQDVHNTAGTRYRCHHDQCQAKVKDWSRADNFRNHLKSRHRVIIDRKDDLEQYIISSQAVTTTECLTSSPTAPTLLEATLGRRHAHASTPSSATRDRSSGGHGVETHGLTAPMASRVPDLIGLEQSQLQYDDCRSERSVKQADHGSFGHVHRHVSDLEGTLQRVGLSGSCSNLPGPSLPHLDRVRADDVESDNGDEEGHDDAPPRNDCVPTTTNRTHDEDAQGMKFLLAASLRQESLQTSAATTTHCLPTREVPVLTSHTLFLDDTECDIQPSPHRNAKVSPTPACVEAKSTDPSALDADDMDSAEAEIVLLKLMAKLGNERLQQVLRKVDHGRQGQPVPKPKKSPPAESTKSTEQAKLPHKCAHVECPKTFQRKSELKKHLKRHYRPYWCTQCPKHFGSKNDWTRHEDSQHLLQDIWKCDEGTGAPDDKCDKVCHHRASFQRHLATQHRIHDDTILHQKLNTCRIKQGQTRFWCGFCKELIELKHTETNAIKGRFNHIDDHNHGRNGLAIKRAEDWPRSTAGSPEAVTSPMDSPPLTGATGDATRKRKEHGKEPARKRAKTQPSSQLVRTWRCCQCDEALSYENNPSCFSCGRPRCDECIVDAVRVNELVVFPASSG